VASMVILAVRLYDRVKTVVTDQMLIFQASKMPPHVLDAGRNTKSNPAPQISKSMLTEQVSNLVSCKENKDMFSRATSSRTTLRRALELRPLTFHTRQLSPNMDNRISDQATEQIRAQDTSTGATSCVAKEPIPAGNKASRASHCETVSVEVKVSVNC